MSFGAVSIWRQNPALEATLRQLWDEGHSATEIGRRMGLNKNQVIGKAHRLELAARISSIGLSGPRPELRKPRATQRARPGAGGTLPPVAILPASTLSRPQADEPHPAETTGGTDPTLPVPAASKAEPARVFSDQACQFPRWGKAKPAENLFCGEPVRARPGGSPSPYCAHHYAVCYTGTNKEAGPPPPWHWRP